jgi:8-oxo-dGTP pyrophosphatase MutT (NUDIX family)
VVEEEFKILMDTVKQLKPPQNQWEAGWRMRRVKDAVENARKNIVSGPLQFKKIETPDLPFDWKYVSRKGDLDVATAICNTPDNRFMFTIQPRLPMSEGSDEAPMVIGFPAGVIDERGFPKNAALRELSEETGIRGRGVKLLETSGRMPKSPGLTNESNYITFCNFDEDSIGQQNLPESEGEQINRFLATPEEIIMNLKNLENQGMYIASGTYSYLKGYVDAKMKLCNEVDKMGIEIDFCNIFEFIT